MSLRILAITGQFRPLLGGTEVQAARLAREWARQGHEVEVWTRRLEPGHAVEETEGDARVRRLGWASRARRWRIRRLEKIHFSLTLFTRLVSRAPDFDVVIVHQALYPAIVAAWASRWTGAPLVVRIASTGTTSDFGIWGALTRPALSLLRRRVQALVVMNTQAVNEAVSKGFQAERVHRIPNGLNPGDTSAVRPSGRTPRVAYLGGFRTEKRVDVLLRAWASAGAPGDLFLAGDGPLRASLQALAGQLGIAPVFLGNVAEPRPWLGDIDVFVLPSEAEGMSNALLEAMAEGCACVGTYVGGNVDCLAPESEAPPPAGVILKGSAGWLVGCGDEKAMADALRHLCADPALRQTLGREARRKIVAEHALEHTAAAYLRIFERLRVRSGRGD